MKKMTLFSLSWPIFIETALFMALGLVDVFVLSRYNDLAASSVNTANQAISICTLVFTVLSTASAVLISQNLGANKNKEASRIAALSITFNLILGLIISAVLAIFSRPILSFIGAKGEILEFATEYLIIVGGFLFTQGLLNALAVIIRNYGYTKLSMYVTVIMNVTNTVLDVIFVLGLFGCPQLGVKGVAIATSVSRIVGMIVLLVVLFAKIEKPSMFKLLKPFPFKDLWLLLKVGVPSAFESFNYNISQLVVTSIVLNCLTDIELITKTYISNISMFFYIFSVSIGQAVQILVGHLCGARKYDEAYKSCLRAFKSALIIAMCLELVGIIFRYQLVGIFTQNQEVIQMGAMLIIINIFVEIGRTTNLTVISSLRGAGDVFFPTGVAIFSMWLVSTLGSYILAVVFGLGLNGLWIAFAADECLRGALMLWRWKKGKWRTKVLV
ncbi:MULTISPECIES: MATE family efflux transporter [unclassified Ruminococcus]|uniref:MATE family efflux transporter n=1 Tax=unclassified Ruminococcus TaxID=2608920 RepID=UPI00210A7548|nr:MULTISPECIES: MATE family efflux transporter [unclassified Ruminococcus]MCQ4023281.1 MATE family efflux transporter [Ruminococcus sp. zg-924]MCQ4115624.1 MATE family efflux transporter [Ruminococcus sp. zg-921]